MPILYNCECDIHMVDNIERTLRNLNTTGKIAKQFVNEIFGITLGDSKVPGLNDCLSPVDIYNIVKNIVTFYEYFVEHKLPLIKNCTSAELRSICGHGFPSKTI